MSGGAGVRDRLRRSAAAAGADRQKRRGPSSGRL